MTPPPLCIIQARYNSQRLPGKMLLTLQGETLIERAWKQAVAIFGEAHTIVAIPYCDKDGPLEAELQRIGATYDDYTGDEHDVLGRFYSFASDLRWHPDAIIYRWTPDNVRHDPARVQRVLNGERLPEWEAGEAFTLGMLAEAEWRSQNNEHGTPTWVRNREHITYAIFGDPVCETPPLGACIDTPADYAAAVARVGA